MNKTRTHEMTILAASIIVSLVVAEIIARQINIKPYQSNIERHEFDHVLGWKTRKSYTTFISRRSYAHFLYYDADGFPSHKNGIEESASREEPSIALIGDSFIEGAYLPYEKTIAAILDSRTLKQVLNFGVDGYSPAQYLLTARERFHEYNVTDIVVFLFAYNDTPFVNLDSYLGYEIPLVSVPDFVPVNVPLERKQGSEQDRNFVLKVLDELALWSIAKPLVGYFFQSDQITTENSTYNFTAMEKALQLIGRIHVEFPSSSFHVYYIPDISELIEKEVVEHNIDTFVQICSGLELKCVIPSPFLENDFEKLYIPIDRHFSEDGAMRVADQLHDLIEEEDD